MTILTGRSQVSTTFTGRTMLQSDLGYGLNELFSIMTDENNSRIVFNTGTFVVAPTIYTSRPLIV